METQKLRLDTRLKPRECGSLPPEKLEQILGRIYPKETVKELMERFVEEGKENEP